MHARHVGVEGESAPSTGLAVPARCRPVPRPRPAVNRSRGPGLASTGPAAPCDRAGKQPERRLTRPTALAPAPLRRAQLAWLGPLLGALARPETVHGRPVVNRSALACVTPDVERDAAEDDGGADRDDDRRVD